MNAFVNILKYGLVVVLVALAMFIVACGCLVLFPNVSIFGLSYVNYDAKTILKQYHVSEEPYSTSDTIRVDAGVVNVDVDIVNTTKITNGASHLNVTLERNIKGFAIGSEEDKKMEMISTQLTEGGEKILEIKITQPQKALLFNNGSLLKLMVNEDLLKEKNLVIKTTSGEVVVGQKPVYEDGELTSNSVQLQSLEVETNNGSVTLGCLNVTSPIKVTQNSGEITALTDLNVSATLSQKTGFGNINLKNIGAEDNPQNLVVNGMFNSTLKVGTIYGDFLGDEINGGNVKIDTIAKDCVINNDYADFSFEHLKGSLVYNANDGALKIAKADKSVNINHKKGSVQIEELGSNAQDIVHTITCENAAVNIANLHNSVNITTTKGSINVVGNKDDTTPVTITVVTNDGAVNLSKINGNVVYKCESGNSSIRAEYANIVGGSSYLNQSGAIKILTPFNKNTAMWLRWETKKSAKINLIGYESTLKTSAADTEHCQWNGDKELGISLNGATASTGEYVQIATRMGTISVDRQSTQS
ncbi:MAG: hypothetical protein IJU58_02165 [Clostridia bacterium]|nr:hypothetical protein [Clostridia bacterium]